MQPVTFYTDRDIHQQVMNCFDHGAELITETIYLTPANNKLSEYALTCIHKQLPTYTPIRDIKVFHAGNKQLIVLTCQLIKNTVKCTVNTHNKDILQLHDLLMDMYNKSSATASLILKREAAIINSYSLEVYQDSPKKEPIKIFHDITKPLLLQMDNFMNNH